MTPIRNLGNGLTLGPLENESDAQQFIHLHQTFTGEGDICDRLIHRLPDVTLQDFFVVKDTASGQVVSTTCFLPWVVNYDGTPLKAAQLEMVITHPDYRRHGLVRAQLDYFKEAVVERGFDFSVIQGIPYFYRQFGYGYSLDAEAYISLPTWQIPDSTLAGAVRFRSPCPEDYTRLTDAYQAAMSHQQLWVQRTTQHWKYYIDDMWRPLRIIESEVDGAWMGYLWGRVRDGVFYLKENAINAPEAIPAVLAKIKSEFPGEIRVFGNPADPLYRWAVALGGSAPSPYQNLINAPDAGKLLTRIAPVLDKRLSGAGLNQLTTHLLINFYRLAVDVVIENGRIAAVEDQGFVDTSIAAPERSDLCIPPDAFARLVFGYRDLDALKDAWPDVNVQPRSRRLLDVLFPRMSALILMPY